jgi:hypothetical protein
MDCHYEKENSKNTNLIVSYNNQFSDIKLNSDTVTFKYNVKDPYILDIHIVNSSIMKLAASRIGKVNNNNIGYEFIENFGFLQFVEFFRFKQENSDVILKITIPIASQTQKDEIIVFMKVFNWPIFPTKLDSLKG